MIEMRSKSPIGGAKNPHETRAEGKIKENLEKIG